MLYIKIKIIIIYIKTETKEFKILLLGDSCVGKTCFFFKYIERTFSNIHLATIGIDIKHKKMKMEDGKNIKLIIYDTAGLEGLRYISKAYYKKADGMVLIYDITNKQSFYNLKNWINQIREEVYDKLPIILVGNKKDFEEQRKVTEEQGKNLAKEYGLAFFECSAITGENIDDIFNELTKNMLYLEPKSKELKKKKRREIKEKFVIQRLNTIMKYLSY